MERRKSERSLARNEKLSRRLVLKISLWAFIVLVFAVVISFYTAYPHFQNRAIASLKQNVQLASEPTELLFSQVSKQAEILRDSFIRNYNHLLANKSAPPKYDSWFEETSEGVMRLREEYYSGVDADGVYFDKMSAFIGKSDAPLDNERKTRIVAAVTSLNSLGPAWSALVSNSHLSMPENALILFSQSTPWGRLADKDLIMTDFSVLKSSLREYNPERSPNWTGLYYDKSAENWTITYQKPIDLNGMHLANASFDVTLDKLLDDIQNRKSKNIKYMILNNKGELISASNIASELADQPALTPQNYDEPVYQAMHKVILSAVEQQNQSISMQVVADNVAIIRPLESLGWWYVALYSQDTIRAQAAKQASMLAITGSAVLVLLLCVVYWQVNREVAKPLRQLAEVANLMDEKNYQNVISNATTKWELKGELKLVLNAFITMAMRFVRNQQSLEQKVTERTNELAEANQRLQHLAHIDGLTALMNRRAFDRDIAQIITAKQEYVIALADIDSFKAFNDHYGHEAGDQVLKKVGACLQELEQVKAYRYGGEEFVLLIPKIVVEQSPELFENICKRITSLKITHNFNTRDSNFISISMGVVSVELSKTQAEIINSADSKLYEAKRLGGNRAQCEF